MIEPSELHRVYPKVTRNSAVGNETERHAPAEETALLRQENEFLKQQIERERNQLQSVISDLQKDRDHWRQQATYLLESSKASWLTRLLGRKA